MLNQWLAVGGVLSFSTLQGKYIPRINSQGYGGWIRFYPLSFLYTPLQSWSKAPARAQKGAEKPEIKEARWKRFIYYFNPFVEVLYLRTNNDPVSAPYIIRPHIDLSEVRIKLETNFKIWKFIYFEAGMQFAIYLYPGHTWYRLGRSAGLDFVFPMKKKGNE